MARIANFPMNLLREHAQWHMDHMDETSPGEGVAFLDFHHGFIGQFHAWYDQQPGASQAAVAPWNALPAAVVAHLQPAQATALAAIAADPTAFPTEDALGIAIHPLHDDIHVAAAVAFKEAGLGNPMKAPRFTEFWQLHGLIDGWRGRWLQAHP